MCKYLPSALLAFMAVARPDGAFAQDPVVQVRGLQAYVTDVLRGNPGLRARRSALGAAVERIDPAGALPDPSVTAGMLSVPVPSFDLDAEAMTQLAVALHQTLPGPGKRDAATAMARADSTVFDATVALAEADIAATAAAVFLELAHARTAEAVWLDRLRVAEIGVSVAESRFGAGSAPQTDVLRARLDRESVEDRLDELQALEASAVARADALRGGTGGSIDPVLLVDADGAPTFAPRTGTLPDLGAVLSQLPATSPRVALGRQRIALAESATEVLQIAARPDLGAMVGAGFRFGGREPFLSAAIGVPVPLWSGRKQQPAARAAALETEAARDDLADLLDRTRGRVTSLYADLTAIEARIGRTTTRILPLAEAASASALSRYRVGDGDYTTVLDTQDELYEARLSLSRLLADYGSRRAELAALTGEEWYR